MNHNGQGCKAGNAHRSLSLRLWMWPLNLKSGSSLRTRILLDKQGLSVLPQAASYRVVEACGGDFSKSAHLRVELSGLRSSE